MLSTTNIRHLSLLLLAACVVVGCGKKYPTAPVSGTIRMNGKPLPNAAMTFQPIGGGMASVGVTDENGHYELEFLTGEDTGAVSSQIIA